MIIENQIVKCDGNCTQHVYCTAHSMPQTKTVLFIVVFHHVNHQLVMIRSKMRFASKTLHACMQQYNKNYGSSITQYMLFMPGVHACVNEVHGIQLQVCSNQLIQCLQITALSFDKRLYTLYLLTSYFLLERRSGLSQ